MASATQTEIKNRVKEKMIYISNRLDNLKPESIGGLCIRLLIDNVQSFEQIINILDEVEEIDKNLDN